MTGIWTSPPSGPLTNGGAAWRTGDTVSVPLTFSSPPQGIVVLGGGLPRGVTLDAATRTLRGTIGDLDPGGTQLSTLLRATAPGGRVYDRTVQWTLDPRVGPQSWPTQNNRDLGTWSRGASVQVDLGLLDPGDQPIHWEVLGVNGPPGSLRGLPLGLSITDGGQLQGTLSVEGNQPGTYWFHIYAREARDEVLDPRGEGTPRTGDRPWTITLDANVVSDPRLSDDVTWVTPSGLIGACWALDPSHLAVLAQPTHVVQTPGVQRSIDYQVTGGQLPGGLTLQSSTGLWVGVCQWVAQDTTTQVTIRARILETNLATGAQTPVGQGSQRAFTARVQRGQDLPHMNAWWTRPSGAIRERLTRWIWANERGDHAPGKSPLLGPGTLFRAQDPRWARARHWDLLITRGLQDVTGAQAARAARDYHVPTRLSLGPLGVHEARDATGLHSHDVLYLAVLDPLAGAGGWDAQGVENPQTRPNVEAIPELNLAAQDPHYWPASLVNRRLDLIRTASRIPGTEDGEPADQRGVGLSGREALPMWMTGLQDPGDPGSALGWTPALTLAYLRPGLGPQVLQELRARGMEADLQGLTWEVGDYRIQNEQNGALDIWLPLVPRGGAR